MKRDRRAYTSPPLVWVDPARETTAATYDSLADARATVGARRSPLRVFNNLVKDDLVRRAVALSCTPAPRVIELAVGQGGDIGKWFRAGAVSLLGLDISPKSIGTAVERSRAYGGRVTLRVCDLLDPVQLSEHVGSSAAAADVVSVQMAFHYMWPVRDVLLREISKCLRAGGVLALSLPSAEAIIRRSRLLDGSNMCNDRYAITDLRREPAGDASYVFWLDECVDRLREYLVPYPELITVARRHGLEVAETTQFSSFPGFSELDTEWGAVASLYQTLLFVRAPHHV